MRILFACIVCLGPAAMAQPVCVDTPFACAIEAAIEGGHASRMRAGDAIENSAQHLAWSASAIMERRRFAWRGRIRGYADSSVVDQRQLRALIRRLIEIEPALTNPPAEPVDIARLGPLGDALCALSLYISTLGPDDLGLAVGASDALGHGVAALHQALMDWAPPDAAGTDSGMRMAEGLSAAENILAGAAAPLDRILAWLDPQVQADGSLGGNVVDTLNAIRIRRLAQQPAGDPAVQAHLAWLLEQENWLAQDPYHAGWLWVRTMVVCQNDGLGGAVYAEDFPRLDPRAAGYPEEDFGTFFDVAWHLLRWQAADGSWGTGFNGSERSADRWRSHLRALMTVQSWYQSFSPDSDDDGLVDVDDNCPMHPNPDQADYDDDRIGDACDVCPAHIDRDQLDRDGDQIGDACDNCPDIPNRAQADTDANGLGDACEPEHEEPRPEACNGADDDLDGNIDEGCQPDATLPDAAVIDAAVVDAAVVDAAPRDAGFADLFDSMEHGAPDAGLADVGRPPDATRRADPRPSSADSERGARRRDDCTQRPGAPGHTSFTDLLVLGWFLRRRA